MVADQLIATVTAPGYSRTKLSERNVPARGIFFAIQNATANKAEQDALLRTVLFLTGGAVWNAANDATRANIFIFPEQ